MQCDDRTVAGGKPAPRQRARRSATPQASADSLSVNRIPWGGLPFDLVNKPSRHAAFEGPATWPVPLEITTAALQQTAPGTRASNQGGA